MKNSSDTIGNRTRDLPVCSAVLQPTALYLVATVIHIQSVRSQMYICICVCVCVYIYIYIYVYIHIHVLHNIETLVGKEKYKRNGIAMNAACQGNLSVWPVGHACCWFFGLGEG